MERKVKSILSSLALVSGIAVSSILVVGCGSSDIDGISDTGTDITVERGPILGGDVVDSRGRRGTSKGHGVYHFDETPSYPIRSTGGFIDVNNDGTIDSNDIPVDFELKTSQGNVITILTTLALNDPELKTQILTDLDMTEEELYSLTPREDIRVSAYSDEIFDRQRRGNLNINTMRKADFTGIAGSLSGRLNSYKGLLATTTVSLSDFATEQEVSLVKDLINDSIESTLTTTQIEDAKEIVENARDYFISEGVDTLVEGMELAELTDIQKNDLLYMYEEEKLAGDVYKYFYNTYNLRVFSRIEAAERQHQSAIKVLLDRYSIDYSNLPTGDGLFYNANLGSLYTSLTSQGSDMALALQVGIDIENLDISDLEEKITNTPSDVETVYNSLLKGSNSHLNAFTRMKSRIGG